jgi:hypothetical protein
VQLKITVQSTARERQVMAEKLKLGTNIPVEIAIEAQLHQVNGAWAVLPALDASKTNAGDYGDSLMYRLTDGRAWFAPPICGRKLAELNIGIGEMFTVTKAEVSKGCRRSIEYRVERAEVEPAVSNTAATVSENAPQLAPSSALTTTTATPINSRGKDLAVEMLTRSYEVAILAHVNVRKLIAASGLDLKFDEHQIHAAAMTVYINASKEGAKWHAA